jgi:hypothetical protein
MQTAGNAIAALPHAHSYEVPRVPVAGFLQELARVLPKLIEFVMSHELREHPVWGRVIPYRVPHNGTGTSRGWCIRPDIILTRDGFRICEFDFVPSGRGDLLASLGRTQQAEVLETFADWYKSMGVRNVLYATASTTVCFSETVLFAQRMRGRGINISAGNIDTIEAPRREGVFIDRLFYRSEMSMLPEKKLLAGCDVATAEPYLDSKVIFAMVHDRTMTESLTRALGEEGVAFLRTALPETRLISRVDAKQREHLAKREKDVWVVKATDVEVDHHWGSRGVVVGLKYTVAKFLDALNGTDPSGKTLGEEPIVQKFFRSRDFWQTWNAVIDGDFVRCQLPHVGRAPAQVTSAHATKEVGARIGFYFLVCRETGKCFVTPFGDMRLRQDELVHGASDALCLAVEAY